MEHNEEKLVQETPATETESKSFPKKLWRQSRNNKTYRMVLLATLFALIVVLQIWGSSIPFFAGTSLCLVLIPIVIGGLALGVKAGALLGIFFGVFVFFWNGVFGLAGMSDTLTPFLYNAKPLFTFAVCVIKGFAAGFFPALFHRVFCKKTPFVSVVISAALAPICNTSLFLIGMFIIFSTLESFTLSIGMSAGYFLTAIILVNFTVELAINLITAPAIYRVAQVIARRKLH